MKHSRVTVSAHESDDGGAQPRRPMLYLILEAHHPLAGGARFMLDDLDDVVFARGAATRRAARKRGQLLLSLPDEQISSSHARLFRRGTDWSLADLSSKNGTSVNGVKITTRGVHDGDLIEIGRTFFLIRWAPAAREIGDLEAQDTAVDTPGLTTLIPSLAADFQALMNMARTPMPVVVRGETGTGKELIARAVHAMSGRKGPLVSVNCGALAEGILESELFGSRRGAFSGAEDRPGLIRSADGGTLFLDEIGEMSLAMQVKLLRVLQEREVTPVGGTEPARVNVRFVGATHRNLEQRVEQGSFREDLYGRMAGFELKLPPLRDRREDMGLLIAALLPRHATREVTFDAKAGRALLRYAWPRNIRELDQAVGRAIGLTPGGLQIKPKHLPERVTASLVVSELAPRPTLARRGSSETPSDTPDAEPSSPKAKRPSRDDLAALLDRHGWNIAAVAAQYGKDPRQIRRWVAHYELEPDKG